MSKKVPYPPCFSDFCEDRPCCAQGHRYEWPELVGKSGEVAKPKIEKDNPLVTVLLIPAGGFCLDDFCCNRVCVFLDEHGNVGQVPLVG